MKEGIRPEGTEVLRKSSACALHDTRARQLSLPRCLEDGKTRLTDGTDDPDEGNDADGGLAELGLTDDLLELGKSVGNSTSTCRRLKKRKIGVRFARLM